MNLDANFVNNLRMRIGDHTTAKWCFEAVLERHSDHPFALYFLSKAQQALGVETEAAENNLRRYDAIVELDRRWHDLPRSFGMPTINQSIARECLTVWINSQIELLLRRINTVFDIRYRCRNEFGMTLGRCHCLIAGAIPQKTNMGI